jgi:hypothetical protein
MAGTPFGLDDLLIVRQHCLWMGALWRRLATSRVVIAGFEPGAGYEPEEAIPIQRANGKKRLPGHSIR